MKTSAGIYEFYESLDEYTHWKKFALRCLILPTGDAISERSFSAMNNDGSEKRSRITVSHMDDYMSVGWNGPSISVFKERLKKRRRLV